MKILRVVDSLDPRGGGPAEHIRQITSVLDARGHRTEAVTLDAPDAPWLEGLPFKAVGLGPACLKYGFSGRWVPWLKKNSQNYDCVVAHGLWQYAGLGVWLALRKSPTPYFVIPHGMLDPWFNQRYPLKHLKKDVYWRLFEHRILRDARAVFFTSEEERDLASKSFKPYRSRGIVVAYGTAGPEGDADAQGSLFFNSYPELKGKKIFLFLGRIHPKKGCDLLLEAFARVAGQDPELRLVMAGPDQIGWQGRLKETARNLKIEGAVTWTGMLTGDLKRGALRSAEALVLPSHQENFGMAVAEALSCGLPALISNKVNIWREVDAAGAGLIEPDDLTGTVNLLERWVGLPENEKKAMRANAYRCFGDHFEINRAADSFLSALRECGVCGINKENNPTFAK